MFAYIHNNTSFYHNGQCQYNTSIVAIVNLATHSSITLRILVFEVLYREYKSKALTVLRKGSL